MLESKSHLHFTTCHLDGKPYLQTPGYLTEGSLLLQRNVTVRNERGHDF